MVHDMHSPEGAEILWENIFRWHSRRDLALAVLSNEVLEASPNVRVPTISGVGLHVTVGKLRSKSAYIVPNVLRPDPF